MLCFLKMEDGHSERSMVQQWNGHMRLRALIIANANRKVAFPNELYHGIHHDTALLVGSHPPSALADANALRSQNGGWPS
jgi:hypothetical protein